MKIEALSIARTGQTPFLSWIDAVSKVVSARETPDVQLRQFADKETGLRDVMALLAKGYRLG